MFRINSWKPAMLGEVFIILLIVVSLSASLIAPKNPNPVDINLRLKPPVNGPQWAKALLAEAGLKDTDEDGILEMSGKPFKIKLEIPSIRYLKENEISEFMTPCSRAVGFHVEVIPQEQSVFPARRKKRRWRP